MKKFFFILLVLTTLPVSGCNIDTNDLITAVLKLENLTLDTVTAKAGRGAIHGIKDSLLTADTKDRLDSLLRNLGTNLVLGLQDSLLNQPARKRIDSAITGILVTLNKPENRRALDSIIHHLGDTITYEIGHLLSTALGPKTGNLLSKLLYGSILSDSTFHTLGRLRDTLVGTDLKNELSAIVTKLIDTLAYGINKKVTPAFDTTVAHTQVKTEQTASWIIWTLVAGIVIVLIVGWYLNTLKQRYKNIAEVLTNNIHDMPEVTNREKLLEQISKSAREKGVEVHLRSFLDERGMLGTKTRTFNK